MTNLKDINFGINQYCGPSVMSAMTGKTTDECTAVIMSITGQHQIKGVNTTHLVKAFEKLRFDVKKQKVYGYTLYAVLNSISKENGMYIVTVPKHVVAVEVQDNRIWLIDNHSKTALPAEGSARLTQRVDDVYKVTAKPAPICIESVVKVTIHPHHHVIIERINFYDISDDNVTISLGDFVFNNNDELDEIVNQLNNLTEHD